MSRRRASKQKVLTPDPVYRTSLVFLIVNNLMKKGKKALASRMVYQVMNEIREKTQQDPVVVLEKAVTHVEPEVLVKARRIGGATHQVPVKIQEKEKRQAIAVRWILAGCRSRAGKSMVANLAAELLDAWKYKGNAVRKKEEVNRMAAANRVYQRD
uniref:Small ribosomal subunit protein uS7c n=1 Tax=Xylochloris irregularis TaxID=480381 RepID=A0A097KME9_9CHLO|nr:ribosomal protein S7 [Xylochloris irregularis]YP_009105671.1 ribosomal protein S7 [Xylochloris irregularis]AIT94351.1 ribosomal protein S7 [Xylochloris irregularis]AIT94366.1 ribosomal protein S7 [Xylochloris irregularis]